MPGVWKARAGIAVHPYGTQDSTGGVRGDDDRGDAADPHAGIATASAGDEHEQSGVATFVASCRVCEKEGAGQDGNCGSRRAGQRFGGASHRTSARIHSNTERQACVDQRRQRTNYGHTGRNRCVGVEDAAEAASGCVCAATDERSAADAE